MYNNFFLCNFIKDILYVVSKCYINIVLELGVVFLVLIYVSIVVKNKRIIVRISIFLMFKFL